MTYEGERMCERARSGVREGEHLLKKEEMRASKALERCILPVGQLRGEGKAQQLCYASKKAMMHMVSRPSNSMLVLPARASDQFLLPGSQHVAVVRVLNRTNMPWLKQTALARTTSSRLIP